MPPTDTLEGVISTAKEPAGAPGIAGAAFRPCAPSLLVVSYYEEERQEQNIINSS